MKFYTRGRGQVDMRGEEPGKTCEGRKLRANYERAEAPDGCKEKGNVEKLRSRTENRK